MTKDQVKELLDRVLTWPADDQEKVAQFVREVEQLRAGDDITVQEWRNYRTALGSKRPGD